MRIKSKGCGHTFKLKGKGKPDFKNFMSNVKTVNKPLYRGKLKGK